MCDRDNVRDSCRGKWRSWKALAVDGELIFESKCQANLCSRRCTPCEVPSRTNDVRPMKSAWGRAQDAAGEFLKVARRYFTRPNCSAAGRVRIRFMSSPKAGCCALAASIHRSQPQTPEQTVAVANLIKRLTAGYLLSTARSEAAKPCSGAAPSK